MGFSETWWPQNFGFASRYQFCYQTGFAIDNQPKHVFEELQSKFLIPALIFQFWSSCGFSTENELVKGFAQGIPYKPKMGFPDTWWPQKIGFVSCYQFRYQTLAVENQPKHVFEELQFKCLFRDLVLC